MSVPTLPDVKAQLNITGAANDVLLNRYLDAALRLIEARVGPSSVQSFTEQHTVHGFGLNLTKRPVVSITTVTPQFDTYAAIAAADLAFDDRSGAVWRKDQGSLEGAWEVTYDAGWATFPDNYHLATLVTVQHLWRTTRGGSRRPTQGATDDLSVTYAGSLGRIGRAFGQSITLPAAALELLGDGLYYGGIA